MNKKTRVFDIVDFKSFEENGKFYITGYANTKNKPDSYGDVPTNFQGQPVYVLTRMDKNPVCFVDHKSSASNIAGNFISLIEDDTGLFFKLLLRPLKEIFKDDVKDAVSAYMSGFGRALSIGGDWFFGDTENPAHLTKAIIYEISLVGIGADGDALTDVSYPKSVDVKGATPFSDTPITDREKEWDKGAAQDRIKEWAGASGGLVTKEIQDKYKRAFLYCNEDESDSFEAYKLQFADIVDGELKAVPGGVFSVAGAVRGKRGGVDIPEKAKENVIRNINKYYKKMDLETPFESKECFRIDDIKALDECLLEDLFKTGVRVSNKTAKTLVSFIKSGLQRDVVETDQWDADAWKNFGDAINKTTEEI